MMTTEPPETASEPAASQGRPKRAHQSSETDKKSLHVRCDATTFKRYAELRAQRGSLSNDEFLESLLHDSQQVGVLQAELAKATKATQECKYKDYQRFQVAVPRNLVPIVWKVRETLKALGYEAAFSGALNFCVLYFVCNKLRYKTHADDFEVLDKFLKVGPGSIAPQVLKEFLDKEIDLEPSEND